MGTTPNAAAQEFKNGIYKSRCAAALIWTIIINLLAYCVAIVPLALINTSISSITHHWWAILHPSSWLYLLVVVGMTCVMGFVHAAWFTVKPTTFASWLDRLTFLTSKQVLGVIVSHVFVSAFMVRSYLGLFGSRQISNLFETCYEKKDQKCINEWHLFLVCEASFCSIFASISYFLDNRRMVTFPIIQQDVTEQIQNSLRPNLWTAVRETLQNLKWFYLLYFLRGGWLCDFLSSSLDSEREGTPTDSFLGLLSLPLLLNAIILGSLSRYIFLMGLTVFEICQTELLPLEMKSTLEASTPLALTAGLEAADAPLLQCLAYLELSEVARRGPEQRAPAFSLSQPGGHPHTWNQLSASCLGQITRLSQQLEAALAPPTATNNNKPAAARPDFSGLRDLAGGAASARAPPAPPAPRDWAALSAALRGWAERRALLGPLLAESPDRRAAAALAAGRPVIYAVSGIAGLAAASLTEDKYGAAQRHLGALLRALLQLAAALERSRRAARPGCAEVARLAAGLRAAADTALFQLAETFGPHLRALGLSESERARLEPYRLRAD